MFSLSSHLLLSKNQRTVGGFGLVELMVSVSIMVVIVSIVLVRQGSFNGAVLLRSQAYEVALQLRQIQLNAVSASGDSGDFRTMLGVYFDTDAGSNGTYRIFRDINGDNDYDVAEEFGLQGLLDPRFEIRAIRSYGAGVSQDQISVVFERPNFDARFFNGSGSEITASRVEIDIARKDSTGTGPGDIRTVEVTSAGQISVQ